MRYFLLWRDPDLKLIPMSMKQKIVPFAARAIRAAGLPEILASRYGGRGVVLAFHDIVSGGDPVNRAGSVSAEFFERALQYIAQSGLEPGRLSDIPARLENSAGKRFVALTFDDGYKSALEIAAPLLERYNIPATVFVTSGRLGADTDYEWEGLAHYIAGHDHIAVGPFWAATKTLAQKQAAYRKLTRLVRGGHEMWHGHLNEFFSAQGMDVPSLIREKFLDAQGVKALAQSPMIEVGGHSVSHANLAQLDEEQAFNEIVQNKTDLEELLGREVSSFAYPYGGAQACGEREFTLASKAGYRLAVTMRSASVMAGDNLFALPRFGVSGLYENEAVLSLYLSGAWAGLRRVFVR